MDQLAADLEAYSEHAHRNTIEIDDLKLLLHKQRFVHDKKSVDDLIKEYLPMELVEEEIPILRPFGKEIPEKDKLEEKEGGDEEMLANELAAEDISKEEEANENEPFVIKKYKLKMNKWEEVKENKLEETKPKPLPRSTKPQSKSTHNFNEDDEIFLV